MPAVTSEKNPHGRYMNLVSQDRRGPPARRHIMGTMTSHTWNRSFTALIAMMMTAQTQSAGHSWNSIHQRRAQSKRKVYGHSMAMRNKLTPQRILQGPGKTEALSPLGRPLLPPTEPMARQWRVRNHSRSNSGIASSLNRCYLLPRLRQTRDPEWINDVDLHLSPATVHGRAGPRPNPEPGPKTRAAIRSGDSAGVAYCLS